MMSLRAYAAHRKSAGLTGTTHRAVQEAIANGRIARSLTPDGKKIRDAELADIEWEASTKSEYVPLTGPASSPAAATSLPSTDGAANGLAVARARREAAQADLRELELARHRGELIPAKEFEGHLARIEERMRDAFTKARNKLLSIPSRVRQRDPSLSPRHVAMIEELVREALNELATSEARQTKADRDAG